MCSFGRKLASEEGSDGDSCVDISNYMGSRSLLDIFHHCMTEYGRMKSAVFQNVGRESN